MGRAARLPGAAKQAALLVPGCFQKTAGLVLKEKKRKMRTEVGCLIEITQVHRHLHVSEGKENIQPSPKFSQFAHLFYLLRVSHSSGV